MRVAEVLFSGFRGNRGSRRCDKDEFGPRARRSSPFPPATPCRNTFRQAKQSNPGRRCRCSKWAVLTSGAAKAQAERALLIRRERRMREVRGRRQLSHRTSCLIQAAAAADAIFAAAAVGCGAVVALCGRSAACAALLGRACPLRAAAHTAE